jgi:hypothetical protein
VGPAEQTHSHFFNGLEKVGHFSDPIDRVPSRNGGPDLPQGNYTALTPNRFKDFWRD